MKSTGLTSTLLCAGLTAGPVYIALGVLQMVVRPGFDPTRDDLSLMANGSLGWIQIVNFLVTGLLVIAFAAGTRRAIGGSRGGTWGPILLGLYGVGLMAAGLFIADPMNGFPTGTPVGPPMHPSIHGFLHIAAGGIGFLGLIAACFVFARRFGRERQRGWAWFSLLTGVIFFAGFFGIAAGSQQTGLVLQVVTLGFTAAVVLGWAWIAALAIKMRINQ